MRPERERDRLTGASRGLRPSTRRAASAEPATTSATTVSGVALDDDRDPRLVGGQRLERRQLAGQERGRHEVTACGAPSARSSVSAGSTARWQKPSARDARRAAVAIAPPERGAGEHGALARAAPFVDPPCRSPRATAALGVGERLAARPSPRRWRGGCRSSPSRRSPVRDVSARRSGHGRLPAAGDAHHDDEHAGVERHVAHGYARATVSASCSTRATRRGHGALKMSRAAGVSGHQRLNEMNSTHRPRRTPHLDGNFIENDPTGLVQLVQLGQVLVQVAAVGQLRCAPPSARSRPCRRRTTSGAGDPRVSSKTP